MIGPVGCFSLVPAILDPMTMTGLAHDFAHLLLGALFCVDRNSMLIA